MSGFSSYWKINNSVLLYDEVKDKIIKIIHNNWNKAGEEDRYSSYWEFTKHETGKYTRKCCSDLSKKKYIYSNIVVCRIPNLLSKDVDSLLECEKAELADLQHKLDNLYKHKAEGAFIRSRRRWRRVNKILHIFSDWKENKLKITKLKHLWLMAILLMIQVLCQTLQRFIYFKMIPKKYKLYFSDVI